MRQSLRQLFQRDERLTAVSEQGMAGDTIKMLSDTAPTARPDLVLLDITMPRMDGLECCRVLRTSFPNLVIAMFTGRPVRDCFEPARLAGADAYIVKGAGRQALMETLLQLNRCDGQCVCLAGPGIVRPITPPGHIKLLTPRETSAVELIAKGLIQKEVALELGCSTRNVRKLLLNARTRLGARTPEQLIGIWKAGHKGS